MARYTQDSDTIAAISTPAGSGGIGVIRISGGDALPLLKKLFQPLSTSQHFASHQMVYGHVLRPGTDEIVDEVLAVYMQAPRTYTREDVVEIHCHGSIILLQTLLQLILSLGARLADPGEFTKRAFLNGRIDLTKAEAVIDILSAKTRKGVDLAQEQLAGALYKQVDSMRQQLVSIKALIEVSIDFPDEEIEIIDYQQSLTKLESEVAQPLAMLIRNADGGKVMREGVAVVIVGLPNVGKSSLLNTLLQEERALVTDIPGTTRDSIEEVVDIHGIPVRLIDTAGIREDAGEVERLGIKRARDLINAADLVLFLFDGAAGLGDDDIALFQTVSHKPVVLIQNKQDLQAHLSERPEGMGELPLVQISAKEQLGIDNLKQTVFRVVAGEGDWQEEGCVPNMRHKEALLKASKSCERLREGFNSGATSDILAIDLQDCLDHLGDIVGETTPDDVLDLIFEQFCLGK